MPNRAQRTAAVRAHAEALRPVVAEIIASGATTVTKIAAELNSRGIPAAEGGQWVAAQVTTLLLRLGLMR